MARYLVSDCLQEFLNRVAKRTGEKLSKRPESDKQNSQINLQALDTFQLRVNNGPKKKTRIGGWN